MGRKKKDWQPLKEILLRKWVGQRAGLGLTMDKLLFIGSPELKYKQTKECLRKLRKEKKIYFAMRKYWVMSQSTFRETTRGVKQDGLQTKKETQAGISKML